ncbi:Biotin--(acetyl-CoA-carboxylase) ligase [Candidatus Desulfarcum epimagneticum]|uniref:biotin--[biotin carboxyl-carrier protein] ligase n=1 Tax=uncultured Desulfobacteraceae bacterium TaxID=218296 RepID=A0A484HJ15_9BACT|nr:Biotin--(acetyl-CoA-carboxylase) ligase [uncultured Desulfobacteraceae bacterium]
MGLVGSLKIAEKNSAGKTEGSFPAPGAVHYFPEVVSTMDAARDLANQGCPHFTVAAAGRQTGGRGRLTRTWLSPEGGLYFTIVLRPRTPLAAAFKFNFSASLVLAGTLRRTLGVDARVKWPNDVMVKEKKLAGILSEMEVDGRAVSFLNIGVGINVNNDPSPSEPGACSLKSILKKDTNPKALLMTFLNDYGHFIESPAMEDVAGEWKKETLTLGRKVRIETGRRVFEGVAEDVDENGALVLALSDGSREKITHGDCFHTRPLSDETPLRGNPNP